MSTFAYELGKDKLWRGDKSHETSYYLQGNQSGFATKPVLIPRWKPTFS
jgi:hypothetical protein